MNVVRFKNSSPQLSQMKFFWFGLSKLHGSIRGIMTFSRLLRIVLTASLVTGWKNSVPESGESQANESSKKLSNSGISSCGSGSVSSTTLTSTSFLKSSCLTTSITNFLRISCDSMHFSLISLATFNCSRH